MEIVKNYNADFSKKLWSSNYDLFRSRVTRTKTGFVRALLREALWCADARLYVVKYNITSFVYYVICYATGKTCFVFITVRIYTAARRRLWQTTAAVVQCRPIAGRLISSGGVRRLSAAQYACARSGTPEQGVENNYIFRLSRHFITVRR